MRAVEDRLRLSRLHRRAGNCKSRCNPTSFAYSDCVPGGAAVHSAIYTIEPYFEMWDTMDNQNQSPPAEEPQIRKATCSKCGGIRNCDLVGEKTVSGGDAYFDWSTDYYILQCRGCEDVFFQTVHTNSEEMNYDYDEAGETISEYIETIKYWPALSKRKRPEWVSEGYIDAEDVAPLSYALTEVYTALDHDLHLLAGMGIRTCFDIATELLNVEPSLPFSRKLEVLVTKGHIGKVEQHKFETLIEAGHAAIHRGWRPSTKDLGLIMEVLEDFIFNAFVVPHRRSRAEPKLAEVRAKVPLRQRESTAEGTISFPESGS